MSQKQNIINALVADIKTAVGTDSVYDRYKFINEVNDFPSVCIHIPTEERIYQGSGDTYGSLSLLVVGYTKGDADSVVEAENVLLDTLDAAILAFSSDANSVIDSKPLVLSTSGGLDSPYGQVEIEANILYRLQ